MSIATPPAPADGAAPAAAPADPGSLIISRDYQRLLVLAALVGILVSLASWAFLQGIHELQVWVFKDLPGELGFSSVPTWWPLPILAIAGVLIAFAIVRLPGTGGHDPAAGLQASGPTEPIQLPGIVLAAFASVALGMVLGPEAPLLALGSGLAVWAIRRVRSDAPDQVVSLMAAAGAFAAIASLFGSPIVGAVIIIEAAGLGGAMLPVILLPGLLSAGIGSLVFVGMGSVTGLSTKAYAIAPLSLPAYPEPQFTALLWTIALSVPVAVTAFFLVEIGKRVRDVVARRPFVVIPIAALVVGGLAIAFGEISNEPQNLVLFSGQDAMGSIVEQSAALSLGTMALIIVFKGLAYAVSLGSARGGPTFPALFLGIVAGLLAGHLPGFSETPAVAALMGAATVSILRLPLSSILLALVLSQGGLATAPLVIVAVVVAFLTVQTLSARVAAR